jgi:hypothetical protein
MTHSKASVRRTPRGLILTVAACAVLSMLLSNVRSQDIVNIENVPGRRIDENWYRYVNTRYRFEVDIPATGFVYEVSQDGDGMTLTSADGEKNVAVYGYQDVNLRETSSDPVAAFAAYAEAQIDAMRLGGVNITHEKLEPLWFELSTTDRVYLYYQKGLLSPDCPTFTNNLWIKYPNSDAKEFDIIVQRMSKSLVGNCLKVQ